MIKTYNDLIKKIDSFKIDKSRDLSSDEDLSIGIMNLISIEEHLFFTAQKTGKPQYLDILNEVRGMRTELMKKIIKDYEGEVWCISKHLLAASMRLMEVGTKEQKKVDDPEHRRRAWDLFQKSFRLYSLFWAINLKVVDIGDVPMDDSNINFVGEKEMALKGTSSPFDKFTQIFKKAIDCCRE